MSEKSAVASTRISHMEVMTETGCVLRVFNLADLARVINLGLRHIIRKMLKFRRI